MSEKFGGNSIEEETGEFPVVPSQVSAYNFGVSDEVRRVGLGQERVKMGGKVVDWETVMLRLRAQEIGVDGVGRLDKLAKMIAEKDVEGLILARQEFLQMEILGEAGLDVVMVNEKKSGDDEDVHAGLHRLSESNAASLGEVDGWPVLYMYYKVLLEEEVFEGVREGVRELVHEYGAFLVMRLLGIPKADLPKSEHVSQPDGSPFAITHLFDAAFLRMIAVYERNVEEAEELRRRNDDVENSDSQE